MFVGTCLQLHYLHSLKSLIRGYYLKMYLKTVKILKAGR